LLAPIDLFFSIIIHTHSSNPQSTFIIIEQVSFSIQFALFNFSTNFSSNPKINQSIKMRFMSIALLSLALPSALALPTVGKRATARTFAELTIRYTPSKAPIR
jgi:hypothetical protein